MSDPFLKTVETKRLFIGTMLPGDDQDRIAQLAIKTDPITSKSIRFVRPEKLHLTWCFFGDLKADLIEVVTQRISATLTGCTQTSITFTKASLFPSDRNPHALVLLPETRSIDFNNFTDKLLPALTSFRQKPEARGFNPHITILRLPKDTNKTSIKPEDFSWQGLLPLTLIVNRVCLIESHLGTANDYRILKEFSL